MSECHLKIFNPPLNLKAAPAGKVVVLEIKYGLSICHKINNGMYAGFF